MTWDLLFQIGTIACLVALLALLVRQYWRRR